MKRLQQFNSLLFYNNASVYMLVLSLLYAEKTKWQRDWKNGFL